jgi:protein CpxP
MNKVTFLSVLIAVLLLSNIALVIFMINQKSSLPNHLGPRNKIIEKLGFDDIQVKAYDKLIQWHRQEISKTEKEMMGLKNQLYSNLSAHNAVGPKDSLIKKISEVQIKIENIHYRHFEDLSKLCKANQKKAFKDLTLQIATLFSHPPIKGKQ